MLIETAENWPFFIPDDMQNSLIIAMFCILMTLVVLHTLYMDGAARDNSISSAEMSFFAGV